MITLIVLTVLFVKAGFGYFASFGLAFATMFVDAYIIRAFEERERRRIELACPPWQSKQYPEYK